MTTPILPPIPPTPTAASTGAEWDLYLRAVGEHNRAAQVEAQVAHAAAQAATAMAMENAAAAQTALLAALNLQPPATSGKPTKAQIVRGFVEALTARPIPALSSAPSPASIASTAGLIADAYISANPGAVEG